MLCHTPSPDCSSLRSSLDFRGCSGGAKRRPVFSPHLSSQSMVESGKSKKRKRQERREKMEMNASSASEWAVMTYGSAMLGDERRTQRAVKIASALARDPMGS